MKTTHVAYYRDDYTPGRRRYPVSRDRVAYLLRAARSRRDAVGVLIATSGRWYQIGELCINTEGASR